MSLPFFASFKAFTATFSADTIPWNLTVFPFTSFVSKSVSIQLGHTAVDVIPKLLSYTFNALE